MSRWMFVGMFLFGAMALGAEECDEKAMVTKELCNSIPFPKCSRGYYFDIGLIAENMRITGAQAATGMSISLADARFYIGEGTVSFDFNLDVGLRVGLGYKISHDSWVAKALFEWLSSKAVFTNSLVGQAAYIPYGESAYAATLYSTVSASMRVDYYLLDVLLSRGSYFTPYYSFEPFGGIKASWINYNKKIAFSGQVAESEDLPLPLNDKTKIEFWGVGPMLGFNGNYFLVAGWSIFSGADFSVLLGESNLNDYYKFDILDTTAPVTSVDNVYSKRFNVISPTIRVLLGLQYDRGGFNEDQLLSFRIGFDGRCYFNQYPTILRLTDGGEDEDIIYAVPFINENNTFAMIGLVADIGWYF